MAGKNFMHGWVLVVFAAGLAGCSLMGEKWRANCDALIERGQEDLNLVIEDEQALMDLWQKMQMGEPPDIDFSNNMIVVVARMSSDNSYMVNIVDIVDDGVELVVKVQRSGGGYGGEEMCVPCVFQVIKDGDRGVRFEDVKPSRE